MASLVLVWSPKQRLLRFCLRVCSCWWGKGF